MTTTLEITNQQQITPAHIAKSKALYQAIVSAEGEARRAMNHALMLAHRFGRDLCEYKAIIGHGKWLLWLAANFMELGQDEEFRIRNAQRFMALYQRCPEAKNASEIDKEAERKFKYYYVPAKERQALEGDQRDNQAPHYLTFVNNFNKWDRQVQINQIALPPIETLRHELEGPQKRIIAICGADWVRSLL